MTTPPKPPRTTYTRQSSLPSLTRAIRRARLHTAALEALCTHLALTCEATGRFGLDGLRAIEQAEREQAGMWVPMPGSEEETQP